MMVTGIEHDITHFPHRIAVPVTPAGKMDVISPFDGSCVGTVDLVGTEGVREALAVAESLYRDRENFRSAFHNFDFDKIAGFTQRDINRLLKDEGIVRHRGKIEAVINNAKRAKELVKQEGSLAAFFWRYEPDAKQLAKPQTASTSAESIALSKDLKKLGWKFVGPTTAYAFIQAMGLINDHVSDCVIRSKVERARKSFKRPCNDK